MIQYYVLPLKKKSKHENKSETKTASEYGTRAQGYVERTYPPHIHVWFWPNLYNSGLVLLKIFTFTTQLYSSKTIKKCNGLTCTT